MSETNDTNTDSDEKDQKTQGVIAVIKHSLGNRENSVVIEGISIFVAAGLGLAAILGVYTIGLFGTNIFTEASQQSASQLSNLSRIYNQFEFLLVLIGVGFSGLNYSILAGLVGVESGSQLRDYWRSVGSAAVGAGIGAIAFLFILLIILIFGIIVLQESLNQTAPAASRAISRQRLLDLNILEWIGAFVVFAGANSILGVLSGAIGGISAHLTHKYVNYTD